MRLLADRTCKICILFLICNTSLGISFFFHSNPACLNLSDRPQNSLQYLKIRFNFLNNTLSLSQINNNFAKDTKWDSIQKTTIFNAIPEAGFKINGDATITPIDFSTHLFSVSLQYRELISGAVPKDIFDLAFFGNDLNRYYDISKVAFNRLGYYDVALGFCYPIIKKTDEEEAKNIIRVLNLGIKVHWQKGRTLTQTDSSFGSALTTPDVFLGQIKLFQTTANGANNFAFDFGATTQLQQPFTFGIALLNLNTGFNWTNQPKQKALQISIDSFSLQKYIETGSIDSIFHKTDSTKPRPAFKTSLPAQLLLQASYQPIELLMLSSYYHQYLSNSRFIDNFNRSVNLSAYLNLSRFFATEFSYTTNLKKDFIFSSSFYLFIKGFNFNLAIDQINGFLGKAKRFGVNLNFAQNW